MAQAQPKKEDKLKKFVLEERGADFNVQPSSEVPEHFHSVNMPVKYEHLWGKPVWKKITGITINSTETTVPHGLGIAPNIWFAECTTGNADVILKTKDFDATNMYLKIAQVISQGAITVNLFIKYDPFLT